MPEATTDNEEALQQSEIILYQTEDGQTRVDVRLENETVWLSLNDIAHLFDRDKSVISRHIRNVFSEGELERDSVVANFATVQNEGERTVSRTKMLGIYATRLDYGPKIEVCLRSASYSDMQLLQILQQLPLTKKRIRVNTSISTVSQ